MEEQLKQLVENGQIRIVGLAINPETETINQIVIELWNPNPCPEKAEEVKETSRKAFKKLSKFLNQEKTNYRVED